MIPIEGVPVPPPTQLINPNLHVIWIHIPIGLLFVGTIIELLAFMWRGSGFRAAGRWMILIGALATIPAATTGLYAARQAMDTSPDEKLVDLKREAPLDNEQWDHLRHHIKFNSSAAVILAIMVIGWIGASDRVRHTGHIAYLIALLIAVGLLTCGAWHGGEMVYTHQTGTKLVKGGWPSKPDSEPASPQPAKETSAPKGKWVFDALDKTQDQLRKIDEPTDIHVQFAGWTAALAVITLGLSIRGLWLNPNRIVSESQSTDDDIVNAIAARGEQRALVRESAVVVDIPARVPAARFWLLACLLGILTALIGLMLVAPGSFDDAVKLVKDYPRYMAHTVVGISIVVLTLLLALFTRFAPYNRILIGGLSLLLALALAGQVWLGILLLYDTNEGPINHFNTVAPTTQSSVT
jgi:uncharacterized membrane protein